MSDVAAEVDACLKSAPGGDCSTGRVSEWLFDSRHGVAVRLSRILQDRAARDLLKEAAARTWRRVTDTEGKAQHLWARLNRELVTLTESGADSLQSRVDIAPNGVFAALFDPKDTFHKVALKLGNWTLGPLAIKADLIFPYHAAFGLLPIDTVLWKWVKLPHARMNAVRFPSTGEPVEALPVPPIGDFVAAMVMNRLGMVESLTTALRCIADGGEDTTARANWQHELGEELRAVRGEIWDAPDSPEGAGAMALLQTYLALEKHRSGFEADWSVIPWPPKPENLSLLIIDCEQQYALFKTAAEAHWACRDHALDRTFEEALDKRPSEVAKIIRGGLEWLERSVVAMGDSKEQPWTEDAPEYLPLTKAVKLIDNRLKVTVLSKLCKPDGEMRYMRKPGWGCKVHIGDFCQYMRARQSDPKWAKAYLYFLQAEGKGDRRWFWRCKSCGHEYPENWNAPASTTVALHGARAW